MRQYIYENHETDQDGNPTGGITCGPGISIAWQHGPLGRGSELREPNRAFVEGVIQAAIGRLEFYQRSKYANPFNEGALIHLREALKELDARTADREARQVEGTNQV